MALFTLTHFHQFVQHPTRLLQFLGDLRSFKGYHHNASIEDTVYSIYQIRSLRYSLIKTERKKSWISSSEERVAQYDRKES